MTADVRLEESAAARGARWITVALGLVGLLNYGYGLIQTRLLNVAAYSAFAAGQGLVIWASAIASVSVPWVLVQGLARARSAAEHDTAIRFAMLASGGSGALAACLVGAIATRFAGLPTALAVAVSTFVIFLTTVPTGWLQGQGRMRPLSFLYVGENVLKNAAGVLLVLIGLRQIGALAAFGIGGIVMLVRWPRVPRATGRPWRAAATNRGLWHRALRFAMLEGMVSLLAIMDVVLVAVLPGTHALAASYQASATLSRVPLFIAGAVLMAFFPSLSRTSAMGPVAARAVQMYTAAAVPVAVLVATMPAAVTGAVFPSQYGAMAELLRFTAIAGLAAGGVSLVTAFFQAVEDYSCGPWLGVGVACYAGSLLAGWRIGGVTGLAAGAAVGTGITLLLLGYRLVRREGREVLGRIAVVEPVATAVLLILLRPYLVPWLAVAALAALRAGVRFLRPAPLVAPSGPAESRRVVISTFDSPANPHYRGGGAAVVAMIAHWLAADYEVTVVTVARHGGTVIRDGVRYRQLPFGWAGPRGGQLIFHALLPAAVRRIPHDLWIESFTPPFSTSFLPCVTRAPVIGLAQSLSGEQMWQRYRLPFFLVERLGLRFYRHLVVLNVADHDRVRRFSPAAAVQVIPNSIELPQLDPGQLGRGQHILYLGRIDIREKGLDLLLAAYERSALAMPLVIAGTGTPREEAKLTALLDRRGGDIRRVGHVTGPRKQALLADSAFVVLPSRHEAFGLAALEGMAAAKPVLHFDLPTLRWMDGDVRVRSFDTDALAGWMRVLARDGQARCRLGRSAYAAAHGYGQDQTADRYRNLVRQVLDTTGGRA